MATLDSVAVRDYMSTQLLTFTPDMEVETAIDLLIKNRHSGGAVLEGGKLVGLLSEKDCLKVALVAGYEGTSAGLVREYMTTKLNALDPEMSILEVAGKFLDSPYKRFPVVKDGKLVGQISRSDVLRAIRAVT